MVGVNVSFCWCVLRRLEVFSCLYKVMDFYGKVKPSLFFMASWFSAKEGPVPQNQRQKAEPQDRLHQSLLKRSHPLAWECSVPRFISQDISGSLLKKMELKFQKQNLAGSELNHFLHSKFLAIQIPLTKSFLLWREQRRSLKWTHELLCLWHSNQPVSAGNYKTEENQGALWPLIKRSRSHIRSGSICGTRV